jgi:hypothetical protein
MWFETWLAAECLGEKSRLYAEVGGTLLRPADVPKHGGFRGYVADPDDHAWEIAWTPGVKIDDRGLAFDGP